MYNFKALHCCHCNSLILQLPEFEIQKLNGLSFECECCGHSNVLSGLKFHKKPGSDSFVNPVSLEALFTL